MYNVSMKIDSTSEGLTRVRWHYIYAIHQINYTVKEMHNIIITSIDIGNRLTRNLAPSIFKPRCAPCPLTINIVFHIHAKQS